MSDDQDLTNDAVVTRFRHYKKKLRDSEHFVSIVFLAVLIPVYLIFLFRFFDRTTAVSILFSGLMQGAFYSLIALGFAIIFGISKMFKLSVGGYYVLGAYLAYWLNNILFLEFNSIELSSYSGAERINFTLLYYLPILAFVIFSLLYFKVFDWKIGLINLIVNGVLFVIHRELLVSKFNVVSLTATFQALTIQTGVMVFGLCLYYMELTKKQIGISLISLNLINLLLSLIMNTPRSPALYFSVLLLSVIIVAALSMLVDRYILEQTRDNQTNVLIITFGIALLIQNAIPILRFPWRPSALAEYRFIPFGTETRNLDGIFPKPERMIILGQSISSLRIFATVVSIILLLLVFLFITRTRMGKAMKAVSEDPEAAWLVGINVRKVYLISAGLGMGLAGLAGIITSPFAASPYWGPGMGWTPLIFAIAVVTLGGIGSIFGSAIAGFIIGFTEATIASTAINLAEIVPLFAIFVIIVLRPRGLFGIEEEEE